jgi:molecular chaperone DnaK (HSP70)
MKYWPFTVVDKGDKPHIKIVSNGVTKLFANDFVLVDVNPLTLGIETVGGMMTKSETFRESGKSLKFNY